MKQNIFLIGMPGSGKSTWGKKIAEQFDLAFVDTDQYIEASEGMSISEIFKTYGEPAFREMEKETLKKVVKTDKPYICSTGGGMPVREENFMLMKEHGTLIYLKASIYKLAENLQGSTLKRPLLGESLNLEERLLEIYKQRRAIYEQADFIFDEERQSFDEIIPIIISCIGQR